MQRNLEKSTKMKTNNKVEAPIVEPRNGTIPEYLTADELMTRLEPRIRALFR